MKVFILLGAIATGAVAIAHQHQHHQHGHMHQHVGRTVETVVVNDVAIKYVFGGKEVPYSQVCEGLANGTFLWNSQAGPQPKCDSAAPTLIQATSTVISTPSAAANFVQQEAQSSSSSTTSTTLSTSSSSKTSSTVTSSTSTSISAAATSAVANNVVTTENFLSLLANNAGVTKEFPDGQLPCTFSSLQEYGAVPLDYLGLGGYTAIVAAQISGGTINGLSDLQTGGNGNYFSYSCPQGYMKAQWPTQDSGQTVGGVLCQGGAFHLTNPNFNTLCTAGAGSVQVNSNIGKVISICNTDYPATESETVPTRVGPNGSAKLAITDSGTYFKHGPNQDMTSAEYYLNPAGYDIEEACQWDSNNGQAIGNWAPVNLGLGTDSGGDTAYIGLFSAEQVLHDPASPGTPTNLNYNIKVTAGSETCEYRLENGQGNFYMNGNLEGYLGQTFHGGSVPGVTCAAPAGSGITVEFY